MTNVRRPGFLITTGLVPLRGALALLVGTFFSGQALSFMEQVFVDDRAQTGVVDRSGLFTPLLPGYTDGYVLLEDEAAARAAVVDESLRRLLIVPEDYLATGAVTVVTNAGAFTFAELEDSDELDTFFLEHLLRQEEDSQLRQRLLDPFDAAIVDAGGEAQGDSNPVSMVLGFVVPYMLSIFLIITIFVSSSYLLRSVSEEKTTRVIEIVLSSVTAQELLAGKVIGLGALGLTQVLVWLVSAVVLSGGAVGLLGVAIPLLGRPEVFFLAIVYYVLGFLIYAVLMGSVGALGSDMQESQQLAGIFSALAAVPMMLTAAVFTNPNSTLVRAVSWFPLTAPTMMMMRLPMSEVPVLDIVASIGIMLLSIPLILWLGAKLFRLGLLMYGKRPSLREIFRLLRAA
jgi:ABC-2 type transport system permease protein